MKDHVMYAFPGMVHPDDVESPRFGNHWSNDFATYRDACNFYGCDHPDDIAVEMDERDQEEYNAFIGPRQPYFRPLDDEIPF